MRIHGIRHVPFEDMALIADWARERGHEVATTLALTEQFPVVDTFDWLVVVGGPMAADDESGNPWLAGEKAFVASAIEAGRMVLGVCLGAQIVAEVIGGSVRRNPEKEIGWWPVQVGAAGCISPVFSVLPPEFVACHWHSDTFLLPEGLSTAMWSEACANQAFEYSDRVWGLQFHLEWDERALRALVERCGDELAGGRYVQRAEQLLGDPARFAESRRLLWLLLDAMEHVGPGRCP